MSRKKQEKRDEFTAFVCDDDTRNSLEAIAPEFGWGIQFIEDGGLSNAVKTLTEGASPHILFVDLSKCDNPLSDIQSLAEVCEPGTVVIATGNINDVRIYRDFINSGIHDYLLKPFTDDHLREALTSARAVTLEPAASANPSKSKKHMNISVVGVRGGVGASTIASSIAWMLSNKEKRRTALIDFDLHFGTSAMTFDLEPSSSLTDGLENPERIDGLFIERALVKVNEKLSILSSEAPIAQAVRAEGDAFNLLQDEICGTFECTVLDIPRSILVEYSNIARNGNVLVIVTELTLAGARDTIRIASWAKSNAQDARVIIVANKVPLSGGLEVTQKDFEKSIEKKIDFVIPEDSKNVSQAAKLGKPVAQISTGKILDTYARLVSGVISSSEKISDKDIVKGNKSIFSGITSILNSIKKKG